MFSVSCPSCGIEKAHMTTQSSQIGVHCSCGVTFTVDVDEQTVDDWWERESRSYVETWKDRIITLSRC